MVNTDAHCYQKRNFRIADNPGTILLRAEETLYHDQMSKKDAAHLQLILQQRGGSLHAYGLIQKGRARTWL
ncbi:MAG TPA: hypothetical protein VF783_15575, partial [Terriglobales bacterium]